MPHIFFYLVIFCLRSLLILSSEEKFYWSLYSPKIRAILYCRLRTDVSKIVAAAVALPPTAFSTCLIYEIPTSSKVGKFSVSLLGKFCSHMAAIVFFSFDSGLANRDWM